MNKFLGSGAFGEVFEGKAKGISNDVEMKVAIKVGSKKLVYLDIHISFSDIKERDFGARKKRIFTRSSTHEPFQT